MRRNYTHTYILCFLIDCYKIVSFIFQEAEAEELRVNGVQSQTDLKMALKRIADLQTAFEDLENSDIDSDDLELSGECSEDDGRLTVNRYVIRMA